MIDELQQVKGFRISEPAPSEAARNSARSALTRAIAAGNTDSRPVRRRRVPRWRALAIVLGDFTRAWRDFEVGETFGHPASNHASITSANETRRSRRGKGSSDCARRATNSSRSRCAAAFSTRSTFRRDPSGNRTQAIHRPALSFHRTVGRDAITNPQT